MVSNTRAYQSYWSWIAQVGIRLVDLYFYKPTYKVDPRSYKELDFLILVFLVFFSSWILWLYKEEYCPQYLYILLD